MDTLIYNLINGNLSTAREQAKHYKHHHIREALIERCGYSEHKACLAADWLKGRDCWQAYCDAD